MPVLVADAVGYSRLREEDGAGTLVAIGDPQTSILDPAVQARQGRIAEPRRLVFIDAPLPIPG